MGALLVPTSCCRQDDTLPEGGNRGVGVTSVYALFGQKGGGGHGMQSPGLSPGLTPAAGGGRSMDIGKASSIFGALGHGSAPLAIPKGLEREEQKPPFSQETAFPSLVSSGSFPLAPGYVDIGQPEEVEPIEKEERMRMYRNNLASIELGGGVASSTYDSPGNILPKPKQESLSTSDVTRILSTLEIAAKEQASVPPIIAALGGVSDAISFQNFRKKKEVVGSSRQYPDKDGKIPSLPSVERSDEITVTW